MKYLILLIVVLSSLLTFSSGCDLIAQHVDPNNPHGTYTATIFGVSAYLNFSSDTMTYSSDLGDKRIYKFTILENDRISLTNVVTGEKSTESFRYIKEAKCVVFQELEFYQ